MRFVLVRRAAPCIDPVGVEAGCVQSWDILQPAHLLLNESQNAAETKIRNRLILHEYNKTTDRTDKEHYIFTTFKQSITDKRQTNPGQTESSLDSMRWKILIDSTEQHTTMNTCTATRWRTAWCITPTIASTPYHQEAPRAMGIYLVHTKRLVTQTRERLIHLIILKQAEGINPCLDEYDLMNTVKSNDDTKGDDIRSAGPRGTSKHP